MKKLMLSVVAAVGAAFTSAAANLYVSKAGADHPQYGTGYTDIQTALNASAKGDTVWVEDGFVCDSGIGMDTTFSYGNFNSNFKSVAGCWSNRLHLCKSITLRSVSGTLKNPVIVKGSFSDPANHVTNGSNSVRCMMVTRTDAADEKMVIKGFKFTGGASTTLGNYRVRPGGGVWMPYDIANKSATAPVFEECCFDGNAAYTDGGGVSGWSYLTNCIVVNNLAVGNGGGVNGASCYGTLIATNAAVYGAGGQNGNYTKCTITRNCKTGNGGRGSGIYWTAGENPAFFCRKCDITYNFAAKNYHIGAVGLYNTTVVSIQPLIDDCNIIGNTGGTTGGAISNCRVVNSRIIGNTGAGSVIVNCEMTGCTIMYNTNSIAYDQGALILADARYHRGKMVNCLIARNTDYEGYNCTGAYVGGDVDLYNCTIADNTWIPKKGSRYGGYGIRDANLVNTVSDCLVTDIFPTYASLSKPKDFTFGATNSCFATNAVVKAITDGANNVFGDPKLRSSSRKGVYEQYAPGPKSICRGAGLTGFDYMSADDPDTKGLDLAKRPRLTDGTVDIGAYQYSSLGLSVRLR